MKTRTLALCGFAATLLLLVGGVAFAQSVPSTPGSPAQDGQLGLPDGASTFSQSIDTLYVWIFWITTAMFILTEGLLIYFCIVYRRRPGHRPSYTHGNNAAEITWTIIPALMLLAIAIVQIPTWNAIKKEFPSPGPGVTEVKTFAEQYQWNFMYPNTKSFIQGDNDAASAGLLHIPFGDKALLHIRSKDVIHSLFIPELRVKQDLVPGLRQRIWFEANRIRLIEIKSGKTHNVGKNMDSSARDVQDFVWVNSKDEFAKGGPYKDKTIAVAGYSLDKDSGLYKPKNPNKVRVLKDGALSEDGKWADVDYAVGVFEIACAELCGLGHYKMRGQLVVEPRVAFEAWLKDTAEDELGEIWKKKLWKD